MKILETILRKIDMIALAFVLLLAVSLTGCKAQANAPRSAEAIIEEMVLEYAGQAENASSQVEMLVRELETVDADAGTRWKKIMELWTSAREDTEIHYDILPDGLPDTDALCLIALGFRLEPNGSMRKELLGRLQVVLESAQKYPNAYILCTGGGTAARNRAVTEAGEMAKWLKAHGVAEDRIIVEDQSLTTAQNAIFSYEILTSKYPQVKQLAIISSDYHIETGTLLFAAESILQADDPEQEQLTVVSNAAWKAPSGNLSMMFQAGALLELAGDPKTASDIYHGNYPVRESTG